MGFAEKKRKVLERLQDIEVGAEIDEDIREIIEEINNYEDFFTTSSCSGRILLISLPEVGAKKEAKIKGKWHRAVNRNEIIEAVKKAIESSKSKNGELWLISQSPIIHVASKNLKSAEVLLKMSYEAGFKYSSIKTISNGRIIVEITSTERMDVPLGKDGTLFCAENYVDFIIEKANLLLLRGKAKLSRLLVPLRAINVQ